MLAQVPELANRFTEAARDGMADASAELSAVVNQLAIRPAPVDARPLVGFSAQWPVPGLPVNLAVEGLAVGGYLQGPLPPPRTLVMQSLRQKVRPLFDTGSESTRAAAAHVLAGIHQVFHRIFKPDDNAQGLAVRLAREKYPAADPGSHAIIIHDLKQPPSTRPPAVADALPLPLSPVLGGEGIGGEGESALAKPSVDPRRPGPLTPAPPALSPEYRGEGDKMRNLRTGTGTRPEARHGAASHAQSVIRTSEK
jgi:hypothetical protein